MDRSHGCTSSERFLPLPPSNANNRRTTGLSLSSLRSLALHSPVSRSRSFTPGLSLSDLSIAVHSLSIALISQPSLSLGLHGRSGGRFRMRSDAFSPNLTDLSLGLPSQSVTVTDAPYVTVTDRQICSLRPNGLRSRRRCASLPSCPKKSKSPTDGDGRPMVGMVVCNRGGSGNDFRLSESWGRLGYDMLEREIAK